MLRVKEEEMSARERRDGSYHRRRRYSDDYDSEVELYQQYKAAGLNNNMVVEHMTAHCDLTTWLFQTSAVTQLSQYV